MRPEILLPILIGGAIGAGGILQGMHWRKLASNSADNALREQVNGLENELEALREENRSLRSLVQGGGEIQVEPALVAFVEEAIGLDFTSSPVIHRLASEELLDRVAASIESRFPPNTLDHRQSAWTLMGLLTAEDRFAHQLAATRSLGARAWFDDRVGEAWVTQRFDPQSVPDQAAVVRSLVRILLHQHFPPPVQYPGDEADRAREALHHGAAISIENRYLARQAIATGFTGSQVESGAGDLLASLPVFIRGLATFPSLEGTPRAERLIDAGGLVDALHAPPTASAWFIVPDGPEAWPRGDAAGAADDAEQDDPGTAPLVLEESAGMLGIRLWLETIDPEQVATARAATFDRYQLRVRGEGRLQLDWRVGFRDAEAAEAFTRSALAMAGALAAADEDPQVDETIESPEGRIVRVERPAPDQVRFLNLPSAAPGE